MLFNSKQEGGSWKIGYLGYSNYCVQDIDCRKGFDIGIVRACIGYLCTKISLVFDLL